jgi:hypothetical protein
MKRQSLTESRAASSARHTWKNGFVNAWRSSLNTLAVLMCAVTMSLCVSQAKDLAGTLDNTKSDGVSGALDPPLPVDGGWTAFNWSEGVGSFNNEGPFTFSTAVPAYVSVTDAYVDGDRFEVFDNGLSLGVTSEPVDDGSYGGFSPDCVYLDPRLSSGQFLVGAGDHAITLKIVQAGGGFTYGTGFLRADSSPFVPGTVAPANDDFDDATIVGALPFKHTGNTVSATRADDEPFSICANDGATVWYAFTPRNSLRVRARTAGSDYDTVLSVWTGTRGALSRVICNDDICNDFFCYIPQSEVVFDATAGRTYFVMVGSWEGDCGGNLVLEITGTPPGPCPNPDLTGSWNNLAHTCKVKPAGLQCKVKGKVTVRNIGTANAPTSFVRFYLSDDEEFDDGDLFLKQVATGKVKTIKPKMKTLSAKLPLGLNGSEKFILAVIDANNAVGECDETNNVVVFGPLP